ncbi:MAG: MoxR family ATPase [Candidatus Thermoplasmatota archaeon]|jgi:MoxR-like ATPase|nr:MoxR family ATPase [Candidatus Thermoplasmatota archaeon]MCL5785685.1 MoxR family ATPase [Candidatus Thermoplasmatota archaeon]
MSIPKADLEKVRKTVISVQRYIGSRVIGSERIVRFMFVGLFSDNHMLLEGFPGLAKTMLAKEFAGALGLDFKRIQFTPDMLPSDVTGSLIFNLETRKMEFRKGPVFCNILLADELNRTPPKVQSALLEAMEEKQVSQGGETELLPLPFFAVATQNPIEQEGTFPLAEALLDRFLFRYFMRYPTRDQELDILRSQVVDEEMETKPLGPDEIKRIKDQVPKVFVSEDMISYIVDIIRKTRDNKKIYIGASPRTAAKYLRAVRANALINGRDYVIPEDAKFMSSELLNHRLILNSEAIIEAGSDLPSTVNGIIDEAVSSVRAPQ